MVDLSIPQRAQTGLALLLVVLALVTAAVAWVRWGRVERAMRRGDPLPTLGAGVLLVLTLGGVCVLLAVSWL